MQSKNSWEHDIADDLFNADGISTPEDKPQKKCFGAKKHTQLGFSTHNDPNKATSYPIAVAQTYFKHEGERTSGKPLKHPSSISTCAEKASSSQA